MAIRQWRKIKTYEAGSRGELKFFCICGEKLTIDPRLFERDCPCCCGRIYQASRTLRLQVHCSTAEERRLSRELTELRRQFEEVENHRAFLLRKLREQNG